MYSAHLDKIALLPQGKVSLTAEESNLCLKGSWLFSAAFILHVQYGLVYLNCLGTCSVCESNSFIFYTLEDKLSFLSKRNTSFVILRKFLQPT